MVCDNERLTYGELDRRSNQLAQVLAKNGVRPGTLAGVMMERSPRTIVAILGILKAGGAYVPIDPVYPDERALWMLTDSGSVAVVTEKALASRVTQFTGAVISLDQDYGAIAKENEEALGLTVERNNPAYAIYTSGSTGQPKGVLVTHHNVLRLFEATEHWFQFTQDDVWSLFHSFAFDFSVWELWGGLLYGGTVVVVPYLTARDPSAFYELLAREEVTVLSQTPSAFRQLMWAEEQVAMNYPGLRYVVFGGEALELQSLRPWFNRHQPNAPLLVNMYGITETTVHVTYRPIYPKDLDENRGSVIGEPIPDLTIHLLDDNGKPVPDGTPGEIHVGGEGVALGYLNRPELTAQRFIVDPFSRNPQARLYRSGDLAKRLPDGDLEYLGRIDHQVKIHGFRIELGEIESVLNLHPSIRESVVVCDESTGDKRLLGYVVPRGDAPSVTELREFAGKRLPAYMLPQRIVVLDEIPLTVNGKVDRKALPLPDSARPVVESTYSAPSTEAEKTLAEIWESVLGVSQVGIDDNFFELGGDSIRSIQVLARAEAQGMKISLQTIFGHPTIAGILGNLNAEVEDRVGESEPFALISPEDRVKLPEGIEDAYPIGKLQHGMIYHSDFDKESAIFHDVFSFRFKLEYDPAVLKQAVKRLSQRHTIFRTSFHLYEFSEPLQFVHRECEVPFTEEDLRQAPAETRKAELIAWVEKEKRNRFEWHQAPLMRLHVQRYSDDTFQFIVSFHHAIMDGWSLAMMLTELFQDYCGLLSKENPEIKPPQVTYRDFVSLEQQTIQNESSRKYWKELLRNPTIHKLPRWPHKPKEQAREQTRGPEIYFPSSLLKALQTVARSCGVPIRTVLLAAHCRVMNLLTGADDVLTGLVANGRPQCADGDRLIGLFLNTLPFRVRIENDSWRSLIRKVFQGEQGLIAHRRMPLAEIQQMGGGQDLFETTFDFVQFHIYRDLPGYKDHSFLEDHYFEANNFNFFVTFMLDASGAELQMHFDYDPNEFSAGQIRAICDYYNEALRAMAAMPDEVCNLTPLLPEAERDLVLSQWNGHRTPLPSQMPIELFEEQARLQPEATAVIFGEKKFTYKELDARATSLATKLSRMGVQAGSLVGIYLERSLEMIVGILAIQKAGGAYVPMDPSYPDERLAFMVSDANLDVTVTSHSLAEKATMLKCRSICTAVLDGSVEASPRTSNPSPDQIAYVIYTSGSTGTPKGVQISQRSLLNLLTSMQKEPGITKSARLLAITTLSFDIAGLEIWLPLVTGATVVLADSEASRDPVAIIDILKKHDITMMQATPVMWSALLNEQWAGKENLVALCGGEALPPQLAQDLSRKTAALWNMYGPTETTIWSTTTRITPDEQVTIGKPIDNTDVYILDEKLNPVPIGSVGELYIGGEGLAKGYLNREQLTAEKFIANPFRPNSRLYRTGDLGRFLPDGRIACLGRTDHQVKIRGFRIELEEIETVLEKHPGVSKAVVVPRDDGTGTPVLCAFWVGTNSNASDLRTHLQGKLPSYMVPSRWVKMEELPLTPNGKVDRKRLPAANHEEFGQTESEIAMALPATETEREIAEIWEHAIGVPALSVTEDFFEAGGHSLAAMRVVATIRSRFQVEVPLASFFEDSTIRALAHRVESQVASK